LVFFLKKEERKRRGREEEEKRKRGGREEEERRSIYTPGVARMAHLCKGRDRRGTGGSFLGRLARI
jgi:hypothetical protein